MDTKVYLSDAEYEFMKRHRPGWIRRLVQGQMAIRAHAIGMQMEPYAGPSPSEPDFVDDGVEVA